MNIEIICPKGIGLGTQVICDDEEMLGITHLRIDIPAQGLVEITIKRQLLEEGQPFLRVTEDGETVVACETLRFSGSDFVLREQSIND